MVPDKVQAVVRDAAAKGKGKGVVKLEGTLPREDRNGLPDSVTHWREIFAGAPLPPEWIALVMDVGPWMALTIAKALLPEDTSLTALALLMMAGSATGTKRLCMKGGAGSGKTFTVLMLAMVFIHVTKELVVIDSSQNANLADLAGT